MANGFAFVAGLEVPESNIVTLTIGETVELNSYFTGEGTLVCSIESFNDYLYVDYMFGYEFYAPNKSPYKKENNSIATLNCSGQNRFAPVRALTKPI